MVYKHTKEQNDKIFFISLIPERKAFKIRERTIDITDIVKQKSLLKIFLDYFCQNCVIASRITGKDYDFNEILKDILKDVRKDYQKTMANYNSNL